MTYLMTWRPAIIENAGVSKKCLSRVQWLGETEHFLPA